MFLLSAVIVCSCLGSLAAHEPNIDSNRLLLLPKHSAHHSKQDSSHGRRSIKNYQTKSNDYGYRGSGSVELRASHLHNTAAIYTKDTKAPVKIHKPREDPRLFYQSDTYLKEITGKDMNNEISQIYPGREVVRTDDYTDQRLMHFQEKYREDNFISNGFDKCVRCPHDRTLIAKPGSDRVLLQKPGLFSCSGLRISRGTRFAHMYGPNFDSLLEQGSYVIVGRIVQNGKSLHICKMNVHVVVQDCSTPKHLVAHCDGIGKPCNFTCRDPNLELHGHTSLTCGDSMKWTGNLPICLVRTWCNPPQPPENGRLSCKGTAVAGPGLAEGSKCRVHCARGWRSPTRPVAVCRRGTWSNVFSCQPRRRLV